MNSFGLDPGLEIRRLRESMPDRRERIATAVMQGLLAHYGETGRYYNNAADCSAAAVAYADALIAELDKPKEVKP